jgi:hypothetical protein
MTVVDWSTTDDLERQVRRAWDRGRLLVAEGDGGIVFPFALRLRRPDSAAMSDRFDDVRRWIRALEDGSKPRRGYGYELEWTEIEHRQLGRNRVPSGAHVPTRDDALRLVGKQRQAERFERFAEMTRTTCPGLAAWLTQKPMTLLQHADDWEKILAVLLWFRTHPRPGLYLRQLDIPGVDTKFIETRRALLMELLDLVLPPEAIDVSAKRTFDGRYGLRSKPPLVRFRILDPRHYVAGLSDLTIPASEFAEWRLGIQRVFITENEINGLAFPELSDAIVIFGLGYALDRLVEVRWLREKAIYYWGDIDTHGFAILDRLRATLPDARSVLMDRQTLMQHRAMWVEEDARHSGPLARLTTDERALFEELASDRLGDRVRLEQERVAFGWVMKAIEALPRLKCPSRPSPGT